MTTKREFNFPVWHTQGGGLARQVGDQYIFVEKPHDSVGVDIGDFMPEEWGLHPANELAHRQMQQMDDADAEYDRAYSEAMDQYVHRGHRNARR
mgnify:FL=1